MNYRILLHVCSLVVMFFTVGNSVKAQLWGSPFIKNYSTEEFKGGIQSWGITQDKREFIYVANNFGLLEFNGNEWKRYPVNNGTKVRAVYASSADNRIYVGSQADFGYFKSDSKGDLTYHSLQKLIPSAYRNFDEVWRIYEIEGVIYFATFKNIYAYSVSANAIRVIDPENPIEFSFKVRNKLYTLEWQVGLSELRQGKFKLLPGGEFFASRRMASIVPLDQSNDLVFTAQTGVFVYNGVESKPMPMLDGAILQNLVINQAILLKDGNYAIATQNDGLYLMNRQGKLLLHLTKADGLFDNTIHALYQDVHENLWLGLNNGISIVEISSPFTRIDYSKGISGAGYAALKLDNQIYLGTTSSLFVADQNTQRSFSSVAGSTGQVYKIREYQGQLLMGHHTGPFKVIEGKAQKISSGNGTWDYIPTPGKPDHIMVGSYDGLSLYKKTGSEFTLVTKYKNFHESSRVMDFDEQGNLWIAHGYKGVFRVRFKPDYSSISKVDFYNSKNGFPSDQLINLERLHGKLYFPALTGIYKFDYAKNRFVKDSVFSSFFDADEHVAEMQEDVQGNVYFISNKRVGKLSFERFGKPIIESRVFNHISDKLNDDLPYIKILDSNHILFGAKDGFIHYDATKTKKHYPFSTHITNAVSTSPDRDSLTLIKRGVMSEKRIALPYELNSIKFTYSSAFYERPDRTEYQYYLENFDKDWSGWTTNAEKEYTNLAEGDYTFHVKARNIHGTLSEAKSYTFSVKPPFYRSTWAYVIYLFAGVFIMGAVFYRVEKRYKKERLKIIEDKDRILSEKESEAQEATRLNEQKIMRLEYEKQQAELEHMNRELTSSTFHLLNKNELLNNVKLELQSMVKQGELNNHNDELKKIVKNIEQNITSDADWKQFELHFNHVHGDFTNRLQEKYPDITPQEIKLSTYLRLNLNTKEIAQLLNISVRGVEISRYRLRKRLSLDRSENLTDFILRF